VEDVEENIEEDDDVNGSEEDFVSKAGKDKQMNDLGEKKNKLLFE
jgi:hypothetical protein